MITYSQAAWKSVLPKPATPITKLVLLKLADHADERGYCYPSVELICKETGISKSTVLQHMLYLESEGFIQRQPGHTGRNTAYTVNLAALQAATDDAERSGERTLSADEKSGQRTSGVRHTDPTGPVDGPQRSGSRTPTVIESPLNRQITSKGSFLKETSELPYSSPPFHQAWKDWQTHCRERRHKSTPTAERLQIRQLAEMGETRAIAALRHSTASGYTGLYEPKDAFSKTKSINPNRTSKYHAAPIL